MNREANQEPASGSYGLSDLATIFFRHKKKALFFSLSVMGLATLIILFAPRSYRSEARLFLQVGRESIRLDPTVTTGKTIGLQQAGRDGEVATAIEVLRSREILEQVVKRLTPEVILGQAGPGQAPANPIADAALKPLRMATGMIKNIDPISSREEAVIQLERNFEVDAEHESTVLSLTYDGETPQLAQLVMNTIVDVYREEHARLHQTNGSRPFFERQRDELAAQLAAAEKALRDAKNRMGVGSIESRRNSLEQRLASIELSRIGVLQGIASATARIAALQSHAESMPERVHTSTRLVPNTGTDELRAQLYALEVQLMSYEAKYNGDHPLIASTQKQVEEARRMLGGETSSREETLDTINTNHRAVLLELAEVETAKAGNEAQLAEIDGQRAATLADLNQLNDFEVEIQELDRAATVARNDFYGYAEDLEQARVDEELVRHRFTNVAVAQNATLAEKPVSPSKLLVGALSLLLATAGTTALVLGAEKMDSRVHTEDQVENVLRLPVLASVPEGRVYATAGAGRG